METLGDETSQKLDPEALSTESDEVVENAGSCSESVVQHDHSSKAKNSQKSSGFSAPIRKSSGDSQKGGDISDDNDNEKSSKTTEETGKKKKRGPKPKQNQLNSQKVTGKAVIPIRALTDDEYEDIFSAVLKRMEVDTVNEVNNLEEISTETVNDKDDVKDDFEELLKVEDNFTDKIFDEKQNEDLSADTKNGNVEADVNDADNVSDREAGDEEAQDDQPVEDGAAENQGVYDPDVDESMVNEDLKTPNISNDNLKRICTPKRPAKSSSKKKTGSKQKIARKESNAEKTPRKLDFQHSKNAKDISKKESKERKPKGKKTKKSKREKFAEREIEQSEIWVQCSNTYCLKWRKCLNVTDASTIPDNWECHMNADERYNSCMVPQQKIEEPDEDHEFVFTRYNIGSLVWARMQGFPWWPGMLEEDPDTECFYETDGASLYPKKYHVVFFGDKVSRAWVSSNNVEAFTGAEEIEDFGQTKLKGKNYMKELVKAKEEGMKALEMSVKERISMYGFSKRYKGSWGADFSGSQTLSQESGEAEGEMGAHSSGSRESSQVLMVHEILSNAESVLNEAETVLNELEGSMQDLDTDSDFKPESPKKKKNSKKRKIREDKEESPKKKKNSKKRKIREDKENEKENKTEEMESQPRKRKVEKSDAGEKAKKKKLQEGNDVQDEENAKSMEKEPDKVVQSESDGRVKTEEKPKLKKGKKKNEEKKVSQKKCNSDSIEQVPRNKDDKVKNKGKKECVEERKQKKH
ncbi:zinc finger CW-type PWWP domain protein 1-like isoform X2 [Ptychodera flava]|uniref:zinc finger CW-type PWWP domain protein 1-like isoform X2 n=1 Tax=Ptychodera flava TaxID=63121 RepID=UPI00396A9517